MQTGKWHINSGKTGYNELMVAEINNFYRKDYVRRAGVVDMYKEIKPSFLDFHRMTVSRDYEYPGHQHENYELIWVEHGPYMFSLNHQELEIRNNMFVVIKPGDLHQDHLKKGQSHFVLHFSLNEPLFSPLVTAPEQIGASILDGAASILNDMEQEASVSGNTDRFSGALQDSLLETLFWHIARILPETSLSEVFRNYSDRQLFVSRLYSVFKEKLNQPLGVEEIAGKMGISKRALSMKCSEYLNSSPARLYLESRFQKAETLLRHSDKTVKEISIELGFDSPFNFTRAYKRVRGLTPSEFRELNDFS